MMGNRSWCPLSRKPQVRSGSVWRLPRSAVTTKGGDMTGTKAKKARRVKTEKVVAEVTTEVVAADVGTLSLARKADKEKVVAEVTMEAAAADVDTVSLNTHALRHVLLFVCCCFYVCHRSFSLKVFPTTEADVRKVTKRRTF